MKYTRTVATTVPLHRANIQAGEWALAPGLELSLSPRKAELQAETGVEGMDPCPASSDKLYFWALNSRICSQEAPQYLDELSDGQFGANLCLYVQGYRS